MLHKNETKPNNTNPKNYGCTHTVAFYFMLSILILILRSISSIVRKGKIIEPRKRARLPEVDYFTTHIFSHFMCYFPCSFWAHVRSLSVRMCFTVFMRLPLYWPFLSSLCIVYTGHGVALSLCS